MSGIEKLNRWVEEDLDERRYYTLGYGYGVSVSPYLSLGICEASDLNDGYLTVPITGAEYGEVRGGFDAAVDLALSRFATAMAKRRKSETGKVTT
jgi:hypothetical protein